MLVQGSGASEYSKGKRFLQLQFREEKADMSDGAHYQIKTDVYPPRV